MKRYLPFAIVFGVLIIALGAGTFFVKSRTKARDLPKAADGAPGAEPAHVRGPANALIALEEFGDFECLPCFLLWPALKNIEHDYGSQVCLTFRQHPLPQHKHALDAARAAEAAGLQGKFWEMHDLLYIDRAVWLRAADTRAVFRRFAEKLHLDVVRFEPDLDGPAVAKRLSDDQLRGDSLGIDRTPAVFIDGKRVQLESDVEDGLRTQIEAALAQPVRPK